jgi:putative endonuclease
MYTVYALQFDSGKLYVGMTNDLRRRIHEHRKGKTKSTKGKKIVAVLKIEECSDSLQARAREKYWKSGQGREKLKNYSGVEQSGSSLGS